MNELFNALKEKAAERNEEAWAIDINIKIGRLGTEAHASLTESDVIQHAFNEYGITFGTIVHVPKQGTD